MKLTYLGTAAGEGFPAIFCNCEFCQKARKQGGKNIRSRSQAIINDDLLIDFPPDTFMHVINGKLRLDRVKTLIVTHSHADHFNSKDLVRRQPPYAHNMDTETMQVYCSNGAYERLCKEINNEKPFGNIEFHVLRAFESFTAENYKITPLPARHQLEEDAFIFIIEKNGKRILYAHDTGYFYDSVFEYIKSNNLYFNLVSYDCTNIELPIPDTATHMGFENISRVKKTLKEMKAVDEKTIQIVNHFSHNGNPLHNNLKRICKPLKLIPSYDGLEVKI